MNEIYQKVIDLIDELIQSKLLWSDEYWQLLQIARHINGVWDDSIFVNCERRLKTSKRTMLLVYVPISSKSSVRTRPTIMELSKYTKILGARASAITARGYTSDINTRISELFEMMAPFDALKRLGGYL